MASPDSSLPPDDELAAAEAARRREWAEIKSEILRVGGKLKGERDRAEVEPLMDRLGAFVQRHRPELLARRGAPAQPDPVGVEEGLNRFLDAEREYRRVEDRLLSAFGDLAEARQAFTIRLLEAAKR